jgi:hypothetical protein
MGSPRYIAQKDIEKMTEKEKEALIQKHKDEDSEYKRERRAKNYEQRIGNIYGDYKVIEVSYDYLTKNQIWKMKCIHCGYEFDTTKGKDYKRKNNAIVGNCKNCRKERGKIYEDGQKNEYSDAVFHFTVEDAWDRTIKKKYIRIILCNADGSTSRIRKGTHRLTKVNMAKTLAHRMSGKNPAITWLSVEEIEEIKPSKWEDVKIEYPDKE